MKRSYYIFSNGRLVRHQNTVYLHQYGEERTDNGAQALADAAVQAGCVLEDLAEDCDDAITSPDKNVVDGHKSGEPSVSEPPILKANPGATARGAVLDAVLQDAEPNQCGSDVVTDVTADDFSDDFSLDDPPRQVLSKRPVPIEDVEAFYLFGEMEFNTRLFNFLARHRVPVHFFNYFGFYTATFAPRQEINSGYLLVRQVEHYGQPARRMVLARRLIEGASFNILKNLRYYGAASRGREMSGVIAAIEADRAQIASAPDIATLMGIEGRIHRLYYEAWPLILTPSWAEFTKRVKRPPDNPINALISFGNSLCYTLALSQIYRTPLSPLISFLHEPGERRFSLALDVAEIFKPILSDRLIFKLVNNGELRPQHFDERLNFCYLKESGRKIFLQAWDERLKKTIEHRNLGRKVSYQRLVRLECYRLKKHLLGMEGYEPFRIWW